MVFHRSVSTTIFLSRLQNGGYPMHTSAVLFRREQLIDCGLFAVGKSMGEDIDMWCRLAFPGSFQYMARPSATYRDALDSSAVARNLRREAPFPVFVQRLPDMISAGEVPARLVPSARRYANFLLLEHARLLLDRGEHSRAREVLLQQCTLAWDPTIPEAILEDIVTRSMGISTHPANACRRVRAL